MNEDWKIHLCKSGIYPATVDDIGETLAAAGYAVVKTDPEDDKAAEIERLKAERDNAERCAVTEIGQRQQVEAHNATMQTALYAARDTADWRAFPDTFAMIEQALATDAGEKAAKVLAAVGKFYDCQPGLDLTVAIAELNVVWEAYRAEGQDDG